METLFIIDCNQALQDLYGYSYEELLQLKITDLSNEPEKKENVIQRGVCSEIPIRYHRKKNGIVFPVEVRTSFFELNNKKIIVGNIRDISKRIEIEKQILTIFRKKKDIDIDYLQEDVPMLICDCKEGITRVSKIVNDLKNFSQPCRNQQMRVNINKAIKSTLNMLSSEMKKIKVIHEYGDIPLILGYPLIHEYGDIPLILGYPQKINQMLLNILLNASQAVGQQGEIRIKTEKEDRFVIVSISDNGCGIKKEFLSKIFDPFFTTRDIGQGTGLGMNISYNIVKKHKGIINAKSRVGHGTTFTIFLPEE